MTEFGPETRFARSPLSVLSGEDKEFSRFGEDEGEIAGIESEEEQDEFEEFYAREIAMEEREDDECDSDDC